MIGIRRYVHIAFAVIGLVLAFFLSNIFSWVGGSFGAYSFLGFDFWFVIHGLINTIVAYLS